MNRRQFKNAAATALAIIGALFFATLLLMLFPRQARAGVWDDAVWGRLQQIGPKPATSYAITIDSAEQGNAEQAAVSAFSWGGLDNRRNIVGGALRAYSASTYPTGVWGADIYAVNAPGTPLQLVGAEIAVYQRNHANWQVSAAINTIFGSRLPVDDPEHALGENRYNENSVAMLVTSQPRPTSGEFSGFQTGIRFDRVSLDRSRSRGWTAAIDVSPLEVHEDARFYLVVFRCGTQRCGLRLTETGQMEVWRDVDSALPVLWSVR